MPDSSLRCGISGCSSTIKLRRAPWPALAALTRLIGEGLRAERGAFRGETGIEGGLEAARTSSPHTLIPRPNSLEPPFARFAESYCDSAGRCPGLSAGQAGEDPRVPAKGERRRIGAAEGKAGVSPPGSSSAKAGAFQSLFGGIAARPSTVGGTAVLLVVSRRDVPGRAGHLAHQERKRRHIGPVALDQRQAGRMPVPARFLIFAVCPSRTKARDHHTARHPRSFSSVLIELLVGRPGPGQHRHPRHPKREEFEAGHAHLGDTKVARSAAPSSGHQGGEKGQRPLKTRVEHVGVALLASELPLIPPPPLAAPTASRLGAGFVAVHAGHPFMEWRRDHTGRFHSRDEPQAVGCGGPPSWRLMHQSRMSVSAVRSVDNLSANAGGSMRGAASCHLRASAAAAAAAAQSWRTIG